MRTEHDQGDKGDNESFHIRISASFKRKGVDRAGFTQQHQLVMMPRQWVMMMSA
jgi:hypothetical protein